MPRRIILCTNCGQERPVMGHNLCSRCYDLLRRAGGPVWEQYKAASIAAKIASRRVTCSKCDKEIPNGFQGMCQSCYDSIRPKKRRMIICSNCWRVMPHSAGGMCAACYQRGKPKNPGRTITCSVCDEERTNEGYGMCRACYERWRYANDPKFREKDKEQSRQWAIDHPEQVKAHTIKYKTLFPERIRISRIRSEKRRQDKRKLIQHRRRARARGLEHTLTYQQWLDILASNQYRCYLCGKKFSPKNKPTQDHVLALSKGGPYTIHNILPACGPCNSAKCDRPAPRAAQLMLM